MPAEARPSETRRGWLNFSLWQLFAVMTAFCIYFAYQMSVVRGREQLVRELREKHYFLFVTTAAEYQNGGGMKRHVVATVPIVRRWLGDQAVQSIGYFDGTLNTDEVRTLERTFPEAQLEEQRRPDEPCHPGCFPHGTLVETAAGPRRIETIAIGDEVISISPAGERVLLPVTSIFRTTNTIWIVETDQGALRTTETQPLCTELEAMVEAGKLQPGDVILKWSESASGETEVRQARVLRVRKTETIAPVINLVLGNRESFIAGGFLARSKPPREETHDHRQP
jgi:hypothetical protein